MVTKRNTDQSIRNDLFRTIIKGWTNQQLADYAMQDARSEELGFSFSKDCREMVLAELDIRGQL